MDKRQFPTSARTLWAAVVGSGRYVRHIPGGHGGDGICCFHFDSGGGWARFSRFNYEASFVGVVVVSSIVSWFGMAIPLILAGDSGAWAALRKSLKISNRYEIFLSLLVCESMVGSYLAWYAVHYGLKFLFPAQLRYTAWYEWLVYFVTILASAAVQPPMFIGFSLLEATEHRNSSLLPRAQQAAHIE